MFNETFRGTLSPSIVHMCVIGAIVEYHLLVEELVEEAPILYIKKIPRSCDSPLGPFVYKYKIRESLVFYGSTYSLGLSGLSSL